MENKPMKDELGLGPLNGHAVGRILKEAVRRASVAIHSERFLFTHESKQGYSGAMDDVVTNADRKAQEIYLRTFRECFPRCGVIAEEEELLIEPSGGCTAYFTVDPLDGTKAYVRQQSHGVATMVALVDGGEVLSAYVGDINAEEVYGFRPGSEHVHRVSRLDTFKTLSPAAPDEADPFAAAVLLRDPIHKYAPETQALIARFRDYEVMGSSIGTWTARLWKGEVGALFMSKGNETPWDSTPVNGITRKLGFEFLRHQGAWDRYEPEVPRTVSKRMHDVAVVRPGVLAAIRSPVGG
jgi:fructose-1,6-bisphosphatase/inositol monophosphatase family enzyme